MDYLGVSASGYYARLCMVPSNIVGQEEFAEMLYTKSRHGRTSLGKRMKSIRSYEQPSETISYVRKEIRRKAYEIGLDRRQAKALCDAAAPKLRNRRTGRKHGLGGKPHYGA